MTATSLTLVTPPASEPVTLEEAKLFLRVDGDAEDDLVSGLISAARELAEQYTGLAFLTQTWKLTLDTVKRLQSPAAWWDGVREGAIGELLGEFAPIDLPRGKIQSITSVTTYGLDDEPTTLAPSAYRLDAAGARMVLGSGTALPTIRPYGAMEIVYVAGYGVMAAHVPQPIRLAIKQTLAAMYASRDCAALPGAALTLLNPYRTLRL